MYPTSHTVHVAHIVIYLMVGPSPFEMGVHQSASKQLNFCMAICLFIYFIFSKFCCFRNSMILMHVLRRW